MQAALDALWPLTGELFQPDPVPPACPGWPSIRRTCAARSTPCSARCSPRRRMDRPQAAPLARSAGRSGRDGVHTEAIGYLLAELQSVARAHPDATW